MRLTMRVSSAGDRWMARFPAIDKPVKDFTDEHGKVDVGPIDDYYRMCGPEFVQLNSEDDRGVKVAAYEFLWQLSCCIKHLETQQDGHDCKVVAETPKDRCLERKMNRGKFGFVRLDFDRLGKEGFVRMRVGVGNPKDVVGDVVKSARTFAVDCVRIMTHIDNGLREGSKGEARIIIQERTNDESVGIIDDARLRDRLQDEEKSLKALEEKRSGCPNRVNGYCSPVRKDCELCRRGLCMTIEQYKIYQSNRGTCGIAGASKAKGSTCARGEDLTPIRV